MAMLNNSGKFRGDRPSSVSHATPRRFLLAVALVSKDESIHRVSHSPTLQFITNQYNNQIAYSLNTFFDGRWSRGLAICQPKELPATLVTDGNSLSLSLSPSLI